MGTPAVPVTQFIEEYIASFEQDYSMLKIGCSKETLIKGNVATFLVAGSGGETAVTRGSNGYIPFKSPSNTQVSCTLNERHAPFEMTGFDIFANQGDQRRIMMKAAQSVMHRDIDQAIIDQLDTATVTTGSAATASLDLVNKAIVKLGNAEVPLTEEDKLFAAITPAFQAYLMQITEFASADYVDVKPFAGPMKRARRWAGINWMVHPNLTGVGTSSEKCYLWHSLALGHAANMAEMKVDADYERKQQLSWTNATLYHNAKVLQTTGIVQMVHDGSAYA